MSYVRLDDNFPDHPKIKALPKKLRHEVGWTHVAALCYCGRYLTDGFIPAEVATDFGPKRVIALLAAEFRGGPGIWENVDGGYLIHDYLDYNPTREQVLAKREKAVKRMQSVRGKFARTESEPAAKFAESSPNPLPLPLPQDIEPAESAGSARYANGLPSCFEQTVTYADRDPLPISHVIREWQQQAFGMQAPTAVATFDAIIKSCCLVGCDGNQKQAWECMDHIERAIDKCDGGFKPKLISKIIAEDRRDLCQTSRPR